LYRYIQHYIANVKYILHLAKQFLLFINNTGHMYPERSGEHPSTVPSGHGSRYREREYRKGSRPEETGTNGHRKRRNRKKRCRKTALRRRYRTNAAEQENPESKMPD
jgi:hypothetical protein